MWDVGCEDSRFSICSCMILFWSRGPVPPCPAIALHPVFVFLSVLEPYYLAPRHRPHTSTALTPANPHALHTPKHPCLPASPTLPLPPQDNDIIMCDGSCNRCFHENCVDPPVRLADIPEDEGWLCPACDCKVCGVWGAYEALPLQHITCLP